MTRSEHSIRIDDALHARFPEIAFDIIGTYPSGKPEEFCAKYAGISWINGPSENEVRAALQPLVADGMTFSSIIRDTFCQCCGRRTMITPCFDCEERAKRARKAVRP
jgi:hypothetical protein